MTIFVDVAGVGGVDVVFVFVVVVIVIVRFWFLEIIISRRLVQE